MSLAFGVDVADADVKTRVTALVGLLMTAALMLAAIEQFIGEEVAGRGWLSLACAVACAAWCAVLCRWPAARRPLRLRIAPDGSVTLATREGEEAVPAAVVAAWQLGTVACLRLRPATASFGSGDCLFLLARGTLGHARWHALRRWLVWRRRTTRHREKVRPFEAIAA